MDLARLAGVSAQQIRNYADAGILPPVPRTAAGYRRFGDAHRRALLAYRALASGSAPVRAREIMHAVHAGDVAKALSLVDACHADLYEQRPISSQATRRALETVAETPAPAGAPRPEHRSKSPRNSRCAPPRCGPGSRPACWRRIASAAPATAVTRHPTSVTRR